MRGTCTSDACFTFVEQYKLGVWAESTHTLEQQKKNVRLTWGWLIMTQPFKITLNVEQKCTMLCLSLC